MSCSQIEEIHSPHGKALGDCWSVVNYFINLGLEKKEIIKLSLYYIKGESIKRSDKMSEILPLLEHNDMIEFAEKDPTMPKIHWTAGYKYSFVSTKITWKPNRSKKVCYQFDGKSRKGEKNFPSEAIEGHILSHAEFLGYEVVQLGSGKSLKQCVIDASECEFFIGIDSGMCHLAASVGIPIIFCQNKRPSKTWETNHSNKHFILTKNYVDLINSISDYKSNGLDYYLQNASNLYLFRERD